MGEAAPVFRLMTVDDVDEITAIEARSFSVPWSRRLFWEEAQNDNAVYVVCELDGRVVAYAGAYLSFGDAEVMNVAVDPDARGRGLGTALFARLIDEVKSRGATAITLEVRPSNAAAIRLYEKFGLRSVGRRPHYYTDNDEDALIMWNTHI
ncbi:MAG: ribosomal protein S18-alanine N-acetyltransferase [Selenomonadaceae bacterium]|nr:ribosomal protein S18-alanine N-acetyltransferase [Selenomonadaceae bacterium]